MKAFLPFTTQNSPSRRAVVFSMEGSEPAPPPSLDLGTATASDKGKKGGKKGNAAPPPPLPGLDLPGEPTAVAANDKKPDTMEAKALHEMSAKSTNNHPGVYLLFPGKDAGDPKLVDKGEGHWVLLYKQPVTAGSTPASIGIALTVVGAAAS